MDVTKIICPSCHSNDIAMLVVNQEDEFGPYKCQACFHKFIVLDVDEERQAFIESRLDRLQKVDALPILRELYSRSKSDADL